MANPIYLDLLGAEAKAAIEKASEVMPEPEKDSGFCKFYCKYYDETGEMGCSGLKKDNGAVTDIVIESPDADANAMKFLQLDAKIKELEAEKDSMRASLEGFAGVTKSGFQINWTPVTGRKSVDIDALSKLVDEIPYKVGAETIRLSVKQTGGK